MNESSISISPIQGSGSPVEIGEKNVKRWEMEKKLLDMTELLFISVHSRPEQDQNGQNSSSDGGVYSEDPPTEKELFTVNSF